MTFFPHHAHLMSLFVFFLAFKKVNSTSFKNSIDVADGILVYANFFPFPHHKLNSTPVESRAVSGEQDCITACTESSQCRSLNFKPVPDKNGKYICHLLDNDKFNSSELFNASLDFHHYSFTAPCELHPCKNGGTCYPVNGKYDFKCACVASFRGKRCDKRYKSCAELLNAGYTKNGIYQIQSQAEVIDVYCDQSSWGGGWTMVFKVVSGAPSNVYIYQLWSSSDSLNENKTEALNTNSSFKAHYKNRLVQNWQTANPKEARVALYKTDSQSEILSIVFNATNSNSGNWFSKDRLTHSPWIDVLSEPMLSFNIQAICCGRSFYIIRNHGGCSADAGWLLVTNIYCNYEKRLPKTTVMYSKRATHTNWNVYENVGIADVLLVYIR
ncbi:uncharacterized protein LOC144664477 isoform X2 [Oculina patagonica]